MGYATSNNSSILVAALDLTSLSLPHLYKGMSLVTFGQRKLLKVKIGLGDSIDRARCILRIGAYDLPLLHKQTPYIS